MRSFSSASRTLRLGLALLRPQARRFRLARPRGGPLGRFACLPLLPSARLFGLALLARLEDGLAFGLRASTAGSSGAGFDLKFSRSAFFASFGGVAPFENVFFPVDSQVHFP